MPEECHGNAAATIHGHSSEATERRARPTSFAAVVNSSTPPADIEGTAGRVGASTRGIGMPKSGTMVRNGIRSAR
jgi:hypothetical protein